MLGGRCHFLQRLMQPFSFNPQPTARNLNKPPTILRLGVNRRSKTCKETSLVTCPTNTWKDWRGHLRWVTKQRMLGGQCHFLQRLMQPFSFNPQPTARNLNKPPTILRLNVNRRSKTCKETSLVTCPTNTWKDWRGDLRWVTKQRMLGG